LTTITSPSSAPSTRVKNARRPLSVMPRNARHIKVISSNDRAAGKTGALRLRPRLGPFRSLPQGAGLKAAARPPSTAVGGRAAAVVAIARNGWSRSTGTPGRNQSESVVAISRYAQRGCCPRPSRHIKRYCRRELATIRQCFAFARQLGVVPALAYEVGCTFG
jgi:hypothetical protein